MQWRIKLEATTGWGEVIEYEVGQLERSFLTATIEDFGLALQESKDILHQLQATMVESQMLEFNAASQLCTACYALRPVKDWRQRKIQTLFGTVEVRVPRLKLCRCCNPNGFCTIAFSVADDFLPNRCTPELERIQAELGARLTFREAAKVLSSLLPASPANHTTIRNRLAHVGSALAENDHKAVGMSRETANDDVRQPGKPITVFLDGAHIRAVPGHQSRTLDVMVGKVETEGGTPRRFGFAMKGADGPSSLLRAALQEQGWTPGTSVTVISDGEVTLPLLVKAATQEPITPILDWWHLSIRVRHIEQ
ncbi:hypothetical protein [Beijerinckia mobilis]|uniref:hypothetical protein n=1 Tax=Beijerinckia mobilis TaxID=231434 RepID=UPI00068DD585|nr:hypothetical protein [Beijerinckia mobilis]